MLGANEENIEGPKDAVGTLAQQSKNIPQHQRFPLLVILALVVLASTATIFIKSAWLVILAIFIIFFIFLISWFSKFES